MPSLRRQIVRNDLTTERHQEDGFDTYAKVKEAVDEEKFRDFLGTDQQKSGN